MLRQLRPDISQPNGSLSRRASYELVEAQFNEGLKNTVELLTERNNYDEAVNNLTRAKYTSLLAASLLRFYAGSPIEI